MIVYVVILVGGGEATYVQERYARARLARDGREVWEVREGPEWAGRRLLDVRGGDAR